MENSSYSKTRSPARFLAAFLAFVMVLIVMPVLPASAAAASIQKIVFMDQPQNEGGVESALALFGNPANGIALFESLNQDDGKVTSWNNTSKDWKVEWAKNGDGQLGEITLSANNGTLTPNSYTAFTFAAVLMEENVEIKYSIDKQNWKSLSGTERDGYNTYSVRGSELSAENGTIYIKAERPPVTHNVRFTGIGTTFRVETNVSGKTKVILDGDGFDIEDSTGVMEFTVSGVPAGHELNVTSQNGIVSQKAEQQQPDASGKYTYEIKNVTADDVITITSSPKTYNIEFDYTNQNSFVVVGDIDENKKATVSHGGSFTFSVTPNPGYDTPDVKVTKKAGGDVPTTSVLNGNTTTYTVRNVTEDLKVKITGTEINSYYVTFPDAEGYTLEGEKAKSGSYPYGTKIEFTVKRADHWQGTPKVTVNGRPLNFTEGDETNGWKYSFDVTEATDVAISGFTPITKTVTVNLGDGIASIDPMSQTVIEGSSATFRVTLATGYEVKEKITLMNGLSSVDSSKIKMSPETATPGTRTYTVTVSGVEEDLVLTVGGISKIEYTVTVTGTKGEYTVKVGEEGQSDYSEGVKVKYGEGVTFVITAEPGYRIESVSSRMGSNTTVLTAHGGNKYSVSNVTNNVTVTVTTKKLYYTVTYNFTNSISCANMGKDAGDGKLQYTKKYAVGDGIEYDESFTKYTLTLATPKRDGWEFKGWKNAGNLNGTTTIEFSDFTNDIDGGSFEPVWNVVFTNGSEEVDGSSNAFFAVLLKEFSLKNDVTNFFAEVKTNLNTEDQDELGNQVSVRGWGFFYGANAEAITEQTKNSAALCEFLAGDSANTGHTSKYDSGLYYYKFPTSDQDAMTHNSTFKLHLSGTENHTDWAGAAWVVLTIERKNYLFVSPVKTLGQ